MKVILERKRKRKILGFFVLASFLIFIGWGAAFSYSLLRDLPRPERITERAVAESTKIYDRTGKVLLSEIHGEERRTIVRLEEIPLAVRQATVVAEDSNFWRHPGIDWRGILRSFIKNISEGHIRQGGSTITQQLIKNSILSGEKTYSRKLKEAILAIAVESKYSKNEILEMYLNQIPYGSNAYGIAAAAETYFGKEVKDLTLAEAALLAALPKAPTYYSPYGSHKEELLERKNWILDRLAQEGYLSREEAEAAKKSKLNFVPSPKESLRAPHFVFYIREYLNQKYGEEFLEKGGLRVITTLDWQLQQTAEAAVKEGAERNQKLVDAANAALVAIDARSGEILAMVGSKNFFGKPEPEGCTPGINCKFDPHVNVATRPRQPGSAFKPFVYATAFKKGFTPETVLMDVPTEFNPLCNPDGTPDKSIAGNSRIECYHPENYDGKFRGPVSLRQALAQSLNIPSVKVLYLAGVEDSIKTAEAMGITTLTNPSRYGLSLVLGGAEVTLLEMTSAFGVFAQEGILHPPTAILQIEDSKGKILEKKKEIALPVLDSEIARTITSILSDNEARIPVFSPHSSLYFPDRPVAAKTGTTQDFRDAWVIGYTPSLVAGVWVGNNDNTPMNQKGLSIMVAGPIWHRFLEEALKNSPPEPFTEPQKPVTEKSVLRGQYRAGPVIKIDKISRKLATDYTPPELIEEVALGEIRSILSLVRKEDPLGPPPENPTADPQFKNWQAGIERWLSSNPLPLPNPPQEFDDLHLPEKRPQITILSPSDEKINQAEPLDIRVKVQYHFPLSEVSLFIDDVLEDSKNTLPLSSEMVFKVNSELSPGPHRIKITAYDAVGNKSTLEQPIEVR